MNVAVQLEFKADRKEPLGDLIRRVVAQFDRAGLQPDILATFSDGPGGIRITSAVERALKKHPHLARFERNDAPLKIPGIPAMRRLTNGDQSGPFPIADILALADGVPRSLPFHGVTVHFGHADFGRASFMPGLAPLTGIAIGDSWWVNGRNRSLSAFYAVEADAASKKLPEPHAAISAILAGLGKPRKKAQFVAPGAPAAPSASTEAGETAPSPSVAQEIARIVPIITKYRSGMQAFIERIGLPHDLPPAGEARLANLGASGPLKPTLVEAFKPRGFDCRGGSGTFSLRRRTKENHVVEIDLDVGTWSRSLTFMFHVHGPGFSATLIPPVTPRDAARQYPIGDTGNWEQIVANMGAIVDELERTFVPEVEDAAGPAPEWFEPGR
ncbi:MAG TPA: hypothetical protein VF219_06560 [Vicinamibacterales bacterium]